MNWMGSMIALDVDVMAQDAVSYVLQGPVETQSLELGGPNRSSGELVELDTPATDDPFSFLHQNRIRLQTQEVVDVQEGERNLEVVVWESHDRVGREGGLDMLRGLSDVLLAI
jgi:hypothetical protein